MVSSTMRRLFISTVLSVLLIPGLAQTQQSLSQSRQAEGSNLSTSSVSAIVTSPRARVGYLARARLWSDPGVLSPQDILNGPENPEGFDQSGVLTCSFAQAGAQVGGASRKFLCRTDEGQTLMVKYWDPATGEGNREVFSAIASTRLMWALGFKPVPAWPLTVRCRDCPADPMSGRGARGARDYLAAVAAGLGSEGSRILSGEDDNQGWSWQELEEATASLPPGPERTAQRTHFAALTLLAAFIQHGDRKPEQQRLYCAGPVDTAAGTIRTKDNGRRSLLFERPDAVSCREPVVAIADVGATLGGAGLTSSETNAKMNFDQWRKRQVFSTHRPGEQCRARVTVSMAAGSEGRGNPVIAEEGRRFLLDRLEHLTPDHIRALFTAARVDKLRGPSAPPVSSEVLIQQWVEAFNDKVRQIASEHCQPMS